MSIVFKSSCSASSKPFIQLISHLTTYGDNEAEHQPTENETDQPINLNYSLNQLSRDAGVK